ncbi:methyltransferase family protein [Flavobacteriaceae bacterium MAR_2009_75]|nr:methyltransferase family protein [Flavobacteriaceae bacterium MAR_2009_75]
MSDKIKTSWQSNAKEWIKVIDNNQIGSRQFTSKAIVDFLGELSFQKLIDVGCGEGWLTRQITHFDREAVGVDGIEILLQNARSKGNESFYKITYEEISEGEIIPDGPYDIAVFNFCLYQERGLSELFRGISKSLSMNGSIVVQTIHPYYLFQEGLEYKSQLISDSWKGLPGNFIDGHTWYARTFEDWFTVIQESGMKIKTLKEILNDQQLPVSLILHIAI